MKNKIEKRGGARVGAGRKPGSGEFGEASVPIRIPISQVFVIKNWLQNKKKGLLLKGVSFPSLNPSYKPCQVYSSKVAAGFPSPADDYIENVLDLNEYLVKHQASTFFVNVQGNSMIGAGIHDGDLLLVDRSIKPVDGKIVIAVVDGETTVKRLQIINKEVRLIPENPEFKEMLITEEKDFTIWGVVTNVIHKL